MPKYMPKRLILKMRTYLITRNARHTKDNRRNDHDMMHKIQKIHKRRDKKWFSKGDLWEDTVPCPKPVLTFRTPFLCSLEANQAISAIYMSALYDGIRRTHKTYRTQAPMRIILICVGSWCLSRCACHRHSWRRGHLNSFLPSRGNGTCKSRTGVLALETVKIKERKVRIGTADLPDVSEESDKTSSLRPFFDLRLLKKLLICFSMLDLLCLRPIGKKGRNWILVYMMPQH